MGGQRVVSDYADKVRSISTPRRWGSSERKPVQNEETGGQAGYHVEHWDDRVDAVVQLETVRSKPKIQEE
jgi:hypothetical protein